ncbi:MAG: sulfatase-like hydrolase/transferase [Actinomycetota bacterium]
MTGTQAALASVEGVFIIGTALTVISTGLYLPFARRDVSSWRALAAVSVTLLSFWHWSAGEGFGPLDPAATSLIVFLLVLSAAIKYGNQHYFKLLVFVISVAYSGALSLYAATSTILAPERSVGVQTPIEIETLVEKPDIVLIVLDGYGRSDVIRDLYGYDNEPFLNDLRALGFDVARESVANYSVTHFSLPALLNMSYVHQEGAEFANRDLAYLASQVAGENDLVNLLKANGYTYIHAEADHWHNQCGGEVDICVPGPGLDITGHALLLNTPAGGLFYPEANNPTTALNLARIDQLEHWNDFVRDWRRGPPKFVFLHIPLPHPPLFLDADCDLRINPDLGGRIMNDGNMSEEQLERRRDAWVDQVRCANQTLRAFLSQVDPDAIVVILSDHGPDSYWVLDSKNPDAALRERFSTISAVRLPEPCRGELPDDITTVNIFREVMSCLSGKPIPTLDTRHYAAGFGGPIVRMEPFLQNDAG